MENKLEQLLNSLIEKGWKPFGREPKKHWWIYCMKTDMFEFWIKFYVDDLNWIWEFVAFEMPIRSVVSINSGLWQFVCENGMVEMAEWFYWQNIFPLDSIEYEYVDYQYWIIESSLKDESELEDFLLNSIKIWNEQL
jgi:hypothetical protein